MKPYTAMVLQNLIACLLIGASLHGCAGGHDVWGLGVLVAALILVKPRGEVEHG